MKIGPKLIPESKEIRQQIKIGRQVEALLLIPAINRAIESTGQLEPQEEHLLRVINAIIAGLRHPAAGHEALHKGLTGVVVITAPGIAHPAGVPEAELSAGGERAGLGRE